MYNEIHDLASSLVRLHRRTGSKVWPVGEVRGNQFLIFVACKVTFGFGEIRSPVYVTCTNVQAEIQHGNVRVAVEQYFCLSHCVHGAGEVIELARLTISGT